MTLRRLLGPELNFSPARQGWERSKDMTERRRCGTFSAKHVFRIVGDPRFFQQRHKFLFEGYFSMVFVLTFYVGRCLIQLRRAYAESTITLLPLK